jgi:long-chain acyl-CoA synthetase
MSDSAAGTPGGIILLTGASGFLGAQIIRRLLDCTDSTLYALVRAGDATNAAHRLARVWWDWPELAGAIGSRVQVVAGDVTQPHLGLAPEAYAGLAAGLTHIIHTAADLRVNAPIAELRKTNLQGTERVLELAQAAHADHGLARFSHVSTAYVAGGRTGPVPEDALTDEYGFSCAYEFSKFEGERLVQVARADLPVSVFRPGMIVGDSTTGEIKTFNTFYFPLRLYLEGRLPLVPGSRAQPVNVVPVDYVADAIARLTLAPEAAGLNVPAAGRRPGRIRAPVGIGATRPQASPACLHPPAAAAGPLRCQPAAGS